MKKNSSQPRRIGLVLSAGGMRGLYAHTGFLQSVEKAGFPFSCMAGCSAGAIIASCYAAGLSSAEIEKEVKRLKSSDFYHPVSGLKVLAALIWRKGRGLIGLSGAEPMITSLKRVLPTREFSDCRLPLALIAVNLDKGEKEILDDGDLAVAAAASAAIPFFYEPVSINGGSYCDGGAYERTPKEAICCRYHLDLLLVHEIGTDELDEETRGFAHRSWGMIRLAGRLFYTWIRTPEEYGVSVEVCACGCGAVILTLRPDIPSVAWNNTGTVSTVLEEARRQADESLKQLYSPLSGWRLPKMPARAPASCGTGEAI